MRESVKKKLEELKSKQYKRQRLQTQEQIFENSIVNSTMEKAMCFEKNLLMQKPLIFADDIFGFNRYTTKLHKVSNCNGFGNLVPDYEPILKVGINGIEKTIDAKYNKADAKAKELYDGIKYCFNACKKMLTLYETEAKNQNNTLLCEGIYAILNGAKNYYQACVIIKFVHYILRLNRTNHICLGRFDQYMKPYYDEQKTKGASDEDILEITELFFISMNIDTDIYVGVQQGDNGQSLVLAGVDKDGNCAYNELTEICLLASEELKIIDPKINLRVDKNTPLSVYERATRLTKQGLGFPQYSNDDVVIPAMVKLGYELQDARNYAVAACWEVISQGNGTDIPNIKPFNFPLAIEKAVSFHLKTSATFEDFKQAVKGEMKKHADALMKESTYELHKNPLLSAFISPCIDIGRDIDDYGAKYTNYGIHGVGISTATDSLYAIKKVIYDAKTVGKDELISALEADFVGYETLRKTLLALPKMGNNDDEVDDISIFLMDTFSKLVNGKPNETGGVFRAGTGSAMEYIWSANKVGATADGRKSQQPYGSSFSPSLTAKTDGLLSAISSFTKYDMTNICNGGPFTVELHDTIFRNEQGEKKVALLVKAFIDRGGHQIQLNSINRDILLQAQKTPEDYNNLIVRVWGWSGYFNELAKPFQDHIIKRCEYTT